MTKWIEYIDKKLKDFYWSTPVIATLDLVAVFVIFTFWVFVAVALAVVIYATATTAEIRFVVGVLLGIVVFCWAIVRHSTRHERRNRHERRRR